MARLFVRIGNYFVAEVTGEKDEVIEIADRVGVSQAIEHWTGPEDEEKSEAEKVEFCIDALSISKELVADISEMVVKNIVKDVQESLIRR